MAQKYLETDKIIDNFRQKLSSMRSGRVNASVLENILVEAYGQKMHFHELATITVPEPSQLLITPFDKSVIASMDKAISTSNLGVNPNIDGAGLRLNFPPLTEENKKKRVKDIYALLEEAKIAVRNVRQDYLKDVKRQKDAGELTEDDVKEIEKGVQNDVDNTNRILEEAAKNKEEELIKV
jgi:ribosome recycling factor